MRIVAGLPGIVDDEYVQALLNAGIDEFFVGYVPDYWYDEFGFEFSPNRRYFQGAQITQLPALGRICRLAQDAGARISVTFNEHFVTRRAMALGERLLGEAADTGCSAIVVADPSVIPHVAESFPELDIHVSGDAGLYNAVACELAFELGASRIIFPRELGFAHMAAISKKCRGKGREFEAFVMGEPCVHDGARCFTEHGYDFGCDFCNFHRVKMVRERDGAEMVPLEPPQAELLDDERSRKAWTLGKCGLCAIPGLRQAGITHLKLPGRASSARRAAALVSAMLTADAGSSRARRLLDAPRLCESRIFCYYPELTDE
jgi:collagenase-like PrtC family protease